MDEFCGGRGLFGPGSSDDQPRHGPEWLTVDFSSCFEDVIITPIPAVFMIIAAVFRLHQLQRPSASARLRVRVPQGGRRPLFMARQAAVYLLLLLKLAEIIDAIWNSVADFQLFAPAVGMGGLLASVVILHAEQLTFSRNSSLLSLYWLLSVIVALIRLRTAITKLTHNVADVYRFGTFTAECVLLCVSLGLSVAKEPPQLTATAVGSKPCPENTANLFALLSMWWMNPLMREGQRGALGPEDVWDLNAADKIDRVGTDFQHAWRANLARASTARGAGQKHPLMSSLKHMTSGLLVVSGSLKLVHNLLEFVLPYTLHYFVRFIDEHQQGDVPYWHGYAAILGLFAATTTLCVLKQQYQHFVDRMGMRLQAALVSALFHKSLVLTASSQLKCDVDEIYMLVTNIQPTTDSLKHVHLCWATPLSALLAVYILWTYIQWNVAPGILVLLVLFPLEKKLQQRAKVVQADASDLSAERLRAVEENARWIESITLCRMKTLFAGIVEDIRSRELSKLRQASYWHAGAMLCSALAPFLSLAAIYTSLVSNGERLSPEIAVVTLVLFRMVRDHFEAVPRVANSMLIAATPLRRMSKFLMLDESQRPRQQEGTPPSRASAAAGPASEALVAQLQGATFRYGASSSPALVNVNMKLAPRSLTLVTGPAGCGKSTLLRSLLGKLERVAGTSALPETASVFTQQKFIRNGTITDNIIMGHDDVDEDWYRRVVYACGLEADFDILADGEETVIGGDRGFQLNAGQMARIVLARAVYLEADLYLFDDPLEDLHPSCQQHVIDNLFSLNGLLSNRTIVVTLRTSKDWGGRCDQELALESRCLVPVVVAPRSDVSTVAEAEEPRQGPDADADADAAVPGAPDPTGARGPEEQQHEQHQQHQQHEQTSVKRSRSASVLSRCSTGTSGSFSRPRSGSVLSRSSLGSAAAGEHGRDFTEASALLDGSGPSDAPRRTSGGFISREQLHVNYRVYKTLIGQIGTWRAVLCCLITIASVVFLISTDIWLALWTKQCNATIPVVPSRIQQVCKLQWGEQAGIFLAMGVISGMGMTTAMMALQRFILEACRSLHERVLRSAGDMPLSLWQTCRHQLTDSFQSISKVDEQLSLATWKHVQNMAQIITACMLISYTEPLFLIFIAVTAAIFLWQRNCYVGASTQLLKLREETTPAVNVHFLEMLAGVRNDALGASSLRAEILAESAEILDDTMKISYVRIPPPASRLPPPASCLPPSAPPLRFGWPAPLADYLRGA